tara:strand:- start:297 stop:485 length:189 start_codon:yes stop_codon:yes gene_type:complete
MVIRRLYGDEDLDYGNSNFGPARTILPFMAEWYLKRVRLDGFPELMAPKRLKALEMRAMDKN